MEKRSAYFKLADEQKKIIDQIRPFEGAMLEQVKDYFRIETTWSSNALEGNTLTISETKVLIEEGLTIGGKPLRDTLEAVGHAEAYDFIFTLINEKTITEKIIKEIHRLFYQKINSDEAGRYRTSQVIITGSAYGVVLPENIENEIGALIEWIKIN